jgi:hypothetical protein
MIEIAEFEIRKNQTLTIFYVFHFKLLPLSGILMGEKHKTLIKHSLNLINSLLRF